MGWEGITTKLVAVTTQTLINKLFREVYAMGAFFTTAGITFLIAFLLVKGTSIWNLTFIAFVSGLIASISVAVALHSRKKEWEEKVKSARREGCLEEALKERIALLMVLGKRVAIVDTSAGKLAIYEIKTDKYSIPVYKIAPVEPQNTDPERFFEIDKQLVLGGYYTLEELLEVLRGI